jgi:hypothetical protein
MPGNFSNRVGWCASTNLVGGRPANISTKLDVRPELHRPAMSMRGGSGSAVFWRRAV